MWETGCITRTTVQYDANCVSEAERDFVGKYLISFGGKKSWYVSRPLV